MSVAHNPKHRYDCQGPCKFSWCCGLTCGCVLSKGKYPPPPEDVKDARLEAFITDESDFIKNDEEMAQYWKDIDEDG